VSIPHTVRPAGCANSPATSIVNVWKVGAVNSFSVDSPIRHTWARNAGVVKISLLRTSSASRSVS
jgi:hypothetical protein